MRGKIEYITAWGEERMQTRIYLGRNKLTGKMIREYFSIPYTDELKSMRKDQRERFFWREIDKQVAQYQSGNYCTRKRYQLSEYIKEYLTRAAATNTNEHNTLVGYSNYAGHIDRKIGHKYLDEITPAALDKFFFELTENGNNQKIAGKGLSKRTVQKIKNFLHLIYKDAKRNGIYNGENPVELTRIIKAPKPEKEIFTDEELTTILSELENLPAKQKVFFYIAMYTGARRNEIIGLKWDDINYKDNTIYIHNSIKKINGELIDGTTKTKNSIRYIPASDELLTVLNEYRTYLINTTGVLPAGYILTQDNLTLPIYPDTANSWCEKLTNTTGIKINPHKFRHTAISLWFRGNIDIKSVQKWAGHSNISTTLDIYTHVTTKANDERRNILQDIIKGA